MAKVTLCLRVKHEGKYPYYRASIAKNGRVEPFVAWVKKRRKTFDDGTYHLRLKGPTGKQMYVPVGADPGVARAKQIAKQAELDAVTTGVKVTVSDAICFEVPQGPSEGNGLHHWRDCLNSYISTLGEKTKRNGWKYKAKSNREREANILEFAELIAKPYVEHYTTADMLRYKERLYSLGRANDTVLNKLSCIVTWLKRNGLVSIVGLLPGDERPERRETEGHPYSKTEVDKQMEVVDEHKDLLRLAFNAGMRKMEYAHAERSDIDPVNLGIQIRPKPKYGWTPKTKRGVRFIPLGDNLVRDLLARPEGLLFPNTEGNPNVRIDRIFEEIGKAAGIVPPSNDRACWVHRWRDTWASRQLEAGLLKDRDINRYMGWEGQGGKHSPMLERYARYTPYDDPNVRKAANLLDRYGKPIMVKKRT
jgi:integrase